MDLTTHAVANFTRSEIAEALRKAPYQINMLLGGIDTSGPNLYYIDYLGTMQNVCFKERVLHIYLLLLCLCIYILGAIWGTWIY